MVGKYYRPIRKLVFKHWPYIIVLAISLAAFHEWLSGAIFFHGDWSYASQLTQQRTAAPYTWTNTGLGSTNLLLSRAPINRLTYWLANWFSAGSNITDIFIYF